MTIFSAGNANVGTIVNRSIQLMLTLRETFQEIADLQAWMIAQSTSDLEGLGFSASDLSMLQSALADANAMAQIYTTGLPPSTYPQPASAYVYANSMREIIGPQ